MRKTSPQIAIFLIFACLFAHADGTQKLTFTSASADSGVSLIGSAIAYHKLTWSTVGTVSACSVRVDTSSDGLSWSAGGAITAQTCTSSGVSSVANVVANYIRINVTSFTGTGSVVVVWSGYVNTPAVGGVSSVSGTSPIHSSGGAAPAISIDSAAADGATLGAAAFSAADFNALAGVISTDYANGQKATSLLPGYLSAADWVTFNAKAPTASPTFTGVVTVAAGSTGAPSLAFNVAGAPGFWAVFAGVPNLVTTINGVDSIVWNGTETRINSNGGYCWSAGSVTALGSDVCLSRAAAGVASVDTSTIGDGLGSIKAAAHLVNSLHSTHLTAQTSTATIYTLCGTAAGACGTAGQYRINWYFNQGGTACGTPGTGGVTFALSWTDNAGAHSAIALPMNDAGGISVFGTKFTFQSSNASAYASGEFNIWSTGAAAIQVTNTYTACSVGTGTWELAATAERVQ